ncbi:MAG: hypothetical protein GY748_22725, partial [Planctomycetaceae bacterium]|nr:hypothetical protein [Planctomycetaceae bacterium]
VLVENSIDADLQSEVNLHIKPADNPTRYDGMLYLKAIMAVLHPRASAMQKEAAKELMTIKKLPTETWSTFLTRAYKLCGKMRLGKTLGGTVFATHMLFTQLDEIQDINGIQQFARKMHDDHDKNNMEPWDVISKIQERIIKDRKYWEKEENVDTTPNSSFLAKAPLTRTDNRGQPKRQRRNYLTHKPRWLQNHDPPHLVPGAKRLPNGDWLVSLENINFLYCERCSAGPHHGLWNRTHSASEHKDSIAPNRVR